ncbi:MAG: tyrosine-type recombinase/integrase [Rhizobiales bacterium]|nr:tyrosine-type recombinase/integrase [Hyphomicrobiales bacterium]
MNIGDWIGALKRLEGAYAPSTLRGYATDFRLFASWCEQKGLTPLPAAPETIARYVDEHADLHAATTIKRRLAGIRKVHHLLRLPNPVIDEEVVIAVRRALRRKPGRPNQALGLNRDLRDRLIGACDDDLVGLRNRALIAVGYDTLCRRSELVLLRVEDLAVNPRGGMSILVRRAKNDPHGKGRLASLSTETGAILKAWLEAAEISEGPLFRPVWGPNVGVSGLAPYTVTRILKSAARSAEVDEVTVEGLSGHSMRVGAAQDLMVRGCGILQIMRAGGWKSTETVARYVENVELSLWE